MKVHTQVEQDDGLTENNPVRVPRSEAEGHGEMKRMKTSCDSHTRIEVRSGRAEKLQKDR